MGAADIRAKLDKLILDDPLSEERIPQAKDLVKLLGDRYTGIGLARQILLGLSVRDVPTDIHAQNDKAVAQHQGVATKTNFAFVATGEKDHGALLTLTYRPTKNVNSLTAYSFNPAEPRFWVNQASSPSSEDYIISSSLTGNYFLLGRVGQAGFGSDGFFLVKSAGFYDGTFEKQHPKGLTLAGKKLSLPSDVTMAPAFSDDGRWYAFAKSEPDRNGALPNVKVVSTDPNQRSNGTSTSVPVQMT